MVEVDFFEQFKNSIADLDPVLWSEKHLRIGADEPVKLSGAYRLFADIYRYIGIKALEPNGKPIVMVKGRQTGGTTCINALELWFTASGLFGVNGKSPIRLMHCWPSQEQRDKYSKTKLNTMMSASVSGSNNEGRKKIGQKSYVEEQLDVSSPANNNLSFKQFKGGNQIFIEYAGYDGSRLRGLTIDIACFDECGQYLRASETFANINQSLKRAKYGDQGVQLYVGTPLQKSSDYWRMWNASSQQYFHLRCGKCEKLFPLYTPGNDDWEKVWLYEFIVKCTHCDYEQDKRDAAGKGEWVCYGDKNAKYVGYHLNQLYMPEITKEKIIAEKPGTHPTNSEKTYRNEVLGEFWNEDLTPITFEELDNNCSDITRSFISKINPGNEQKAYLGCDWGKRDLLDASNKDEIAAGHRGNAQASYSCAIVLIPEGTTLFCGFAMRLPRNTFEYRKTLIDQLMRNYQITQACADIGYAQQQQEYFSEHYGSRFVSSNALGKMNNHIKYLSDTIPQTIMFERDYYLTELFEMMKQGRIKFPVKNYDQIAWLYNHISQSMEIRHTERANIEGIRYIKSGIPSDGLMALLNAYLAYKFDITNHFSVSDTQGMSMIKQIKKPSVIAAFAPKRRY